MKPYFIPPLAHLELMCESDHLFCLGQLYKTNSNYRNFFKQKKNEGYNILLDSGIGDHNPITQDELFEITLDLRPNEVIPLDTLFNTSETLKNLDNFITKLKEADLEKEIGILACPQASTREGWIQCYEAMRKNPWVKTIGMSKLTIPHCFKQSKDDQLIAEARIECINTITITKPLHFLGQGNIVKELNYYKTLKNLKHLFRSSDSCITIWNAYKGIDIVEHPDLRIATAKDYFDVTLTSDQYTLALKNIKYIKNQFSNFNN